MCLLLSIYHSFTYPCKSYTIYYLSVHLLLHLFTFRLSIFHPSLDQYTYWRNPTSHSPIHSCHPVHPSIHPSTHSNIHPSHHPSAHLFVHAHASIHPSLIIHLSTHEFSHLTIKYFNTNTSIIIKYFNDFSTYPFVPSLLKPYPYIHLSFIHPPIPPFIRKSIQPLIHALTSTSTHPFTNPIHLGIHPSCVYLFIHKIIHPYLALSYILFNESHSFIHLLIYPSIHPCFRPSIHPSTHEHIHLHIYHASTPSPIHPAVHTSFHQLICLSRNTFNHPQLHPLNHAQISFIHILVHQSALLIPAYIHHFFIS